MVSIETPVFTKRINSILPDEDYRRFQSELILDPGKGKIIKGSGGLRKIRYKTPGKGKSAGVRIIYYWIVNKKTILMLFAYSKNEQTDLTPAQLEVLKTLAEKEIK